MARTIEERLNNNPDWLSAYNMGREDGATEQNEIDIEKIRQLLMAQRNDDNYYYWEEFVDGIIKAMEE